MKIKTSEATGLQLDWGLAKALGAKDIHSDYRGVWVDDADFAINGNLLGWIRHDADPSVCLALMSQHEIDVTWGTSGKAFVQMSGSDNDKRHGGKTLPEAVARCVIAMRLGDEFECPDELGVMS